MENKIQPPRVLLFVTVALLVALSSFVYLSRPSLPPAIEINTQGQPTIGYPKALVHVVVFEEPKCSHCSEFNKDVYPAIKQEFIDTNKILYTIVPVSFLPGSMPAAIAALCIYNANPQYPNAGLFIKYFDYMYEQQSGESHDWATPENLEAYAKATSPAIDLNQLKNCLDHEAYRIQIEKNTNYGAALMGGRISTPTVYVNGIKVQEVSVEGIRNLIKEVLAHEGIE